MDLLPEESSVCGVEAWEKEEPDLQKYNIWQERKTYLEMKFTGVSHPKDKSLLGMENFMGQYALHSQATWSASCQQTVPFRIWLSKFCDEGIIFSNLISKVNSNTWLVVETQCPSLVW